MPHGKVALQEGSQLRFRADVAAVIAARHGATTDHDRARFYGVTPSRYSRVVNGVRRPSQGFIASVLRAGDPEVTFDRLFEVVNGAEAAAS